LALRPPFEPALYSRFDVIEIEGFGDECIRAGSISRTLPTRAHQDHRNTTPIDTGLDPTTQLRAAYNGHHDVGQHQVRPFFLQEFQRLVTMDCLDAAVARV